MTGHISKTSSSETALFIVIFTVHLVYFTCYIHIWVRIFLARSTSTKAGKFDFGETYPETYPSFLSFYLRREERNTPRNRRQKKTTDTYCTCETQSSRFWNVKDTPVCCQRWLYANLPPFTRTRTSSIQHSVPFFLSNYIHKRSDAIYGRGILDWKWNGNRPLKTWVRCTSHIHGLITRQITRLCENLRLDALVFLWGKLKFWAFFGGKGSQSWS